MNKKLSSLSEYVAWLFKQYKELLDSQLPRAVYRLVDIEEKNGRYKLRIQLVGKASVFTTTPEEILADDSLVEQFSSKDIRTITYYATKSLHTPTSKIVGQRLNQTSEQMLFGIEDLKQKTIIEKTATEIASDKKLLRSLSPEEAHIVGYARAQDVHHNEQKMLNTLRRNKNNN